MAERNLGTILKPYRWYILGGAVIFLYRQMTSSVPNERWGYYDYQNTRLFAMKQGVDFDNLNSNEKWEWYSRYKSV
jgi:hypothetical protein